MSVREDGTFSRAEFTFDKERNVYICPEGKLLTSTGRVHDGRTDPLVVSGSPWAHLLTAEAALATDPIP
jgi:hypothetical protein